MERSRLKLIPLDIQGEILLNLNYNDIMRACELKEFENICNNEYFWEKYAKKWKISKIAQTWKSSVKLFPILNFLYNFGPNYVGSVGVYPGKSGNIEERYDEDEIEDQRFKYMKNKGYKSRFKRNDDEYIIYKPYNEYLKEKNIIVPYSEVVLISDKPIVEKVNWTDTSTSVAHLRLRQFLQPPLSSKPYIILNKDKVIIDSQIKGSPIITEDILFASRAFMSHYTSNISEIKFAGEENGTLILNIEIGGLPGLQH